MKKQTFYFWTIILLLISSTNAYSQSKIGNILKTVSTNIAPNNVEIANGIKQALEIGITKGTDKLSAKDGFFGNTNVKILFPTEAQKIEKTLRNVGLNSLADNVVLTLNRSAEDAAKQAKPIFISAIKQLSITDAKNILLGDKDAATQFFKKTTTTQLIEKFKPTITASLNKVNATKYWADAALAYNKLPLVKPINTNLSAYVTQKAIEGIFIQVAEEELKIRNNIGTRNTSLLQKVFGYADTKK